MAEQHDNYQMDQDTAQTLLVEGGTFVFLGVPADTQFGIDMQCWNTEEDFRGIKMIPPGLHYIHFSSMSRNTGDFAPRSGFMHCFKKKEILVKMWDKETEDISKDDITEECIQRLRDNLLNIDRHLGPYPYENWPKWRLLTSQITEELVTKLSPESGIIRSSLELLPCKDEDRPRGKKHANNSATPDISEMGAASSTDSGDGTEPDTGPSESVSKRPKLRLSSFEEKEAALLPDLKPAPGTAIRFTGIPRDKYPAGATPQEVTRHHLDQSYTLELMIKDYAEPLQIVGELQFAYLCFLIGHSLDAFEHWKNLVVILCSCDEAIHKYRGVFFHFIRSVEVHIEEMPEGFLADIVMNKNLVYKKLREFFKTAYAAKLDGRLMSMIDRFRENLTEKLMWDFTGLDSEDEDERPVVVKLNE